MIYLREQTTKRIPSTLGRDRQAAYFFFARSVINNFGFGVALEANYASSGFHYGIMTLDESS